LRYEANAKRGRIAQETKMNMKTATGLRFEAMPKNYAGLCQLLTPRPIHDKVDFENVTEITDAMAGHKLTADQEDYFDLLCRLIEDYEKEHAQLDAPKVTGLEALQHILDAHDMSAADLARLLEVHRTHGAMILRSERKLTLNHVRKLSQHFNVSVDLFLD
jgi:HTH-type transcriptional regulator/antitoxin HigA